MLNEWSVWASFGLFLAVVEVLVPGYIFLGFSIGALATSVLVAFNLFLSTPKMLVVFGVLSIVAWIGLRRLFPYSSSSAKIWKEDINE